MNAAKRTDTVGQIVPPTGVAAALTGFVAGAMAFLAVFALALLFANSRAAERWAGELDGTATVRLAAGDSDRAEDVLALLTQTPGVTSAVLQDAEAQRALLAPWFGPDLPVDLLALPKLIEVETSTQFDSEGLRLRLAAEAPDALFDDHATWREPMAQAASRLRLVGWVALLLILGSLAAMIALATRAALASSAQVIEVLRLIGAEDRFVVRAFTRRLTLRAFAGALVGAGAGTLAVLAIPHADTLTMDFGFRGPEWLWSGALPLLSGLVAYATTRLVTERRLKEIL